MQLSFGELNHDPHAALLPGHYLESRLSSFEAAAESELRPLASFVGSTSETEPRLARRGDASAAARPEPAGSLLLPPLSDETVLAKEV